MGKLREVLSDPKFWVKTHGSLIVVWILLAIPAVLWWLNSVPFLVFISVYAVIAGHGASWQAARADRDSPTREDLRRIERKVDSLLMTGMR